MGRFSGTLLVSDVDGTLLGHSGAILPVDRRAISGFIADGGMFTLATGRTRLALKTLLSQLELNAPALLGNGAIAHDYTSGKTLFEKCLDGDYLSIAKLVEREFPEVAIEIHYTDDIRVFRPNDGSRAHFAYIGAKSEPLLSLDDAPKPWLKIVFIEQPDCIARLRKFITGHVGEAYSIVSAYPLFLEFLHKDANKGAGLARLAGMLGISHENVYCIGDADNDLPMLTRFNSFVPGNAAPEIKAAAKHIVRDCDSGAVAGAIEWLYANG